MTLEEKAREFTNTLQGALNRTITQGIRLKYVGDPRGVVGYVGYRLKENSDYIGKPIPVTLGKKTSCWLMLNQTVTLEDEGNLKTTRATAAVYADRDQQSRLLSYEFDRDAENEYPSAHLQIDAESEALEVIAKRCSVKPQFERLHLPVGGVRFRPCLEDVIEFLIVERIAEAREDWEKAISESRSRFHRIQLKAAIRNEPDAAVSQLKSMGYVIEQPPG